jgi:hypothetical protein
MGFYSVMEKLKHEEEIAPDNLLRWGARDR